MVGKERGLLRIDIPWDANRKHSIKGKTIQ
jgi:hypothetical protein